MHIRHQISIIAFLGVIFNSYYSNYINVAKIKFNSGSQFISNKNILENLLKKHVFLHNYFCDNKLKDNLQDSICKYNLDKFTNFKNYKEAEIMINILYKSNSNMCMNILELFDLNKINNDLHKFVLYCDEFHIPYINYINEILILCFNLMIIISSLMHIYKFFFHHINIKKIEKKIIFKNIINKINYNSDLDICSICHDSYTHESIDITELKSCKHVYHYKCIKEWLVTHKHTNCPLCNKNVVNNN